MSSSWCLRVLALCLLLVSAAAQSGVAPHLLSSIPDAVQGAVMSADGSTVYAVSFTALYAVNLAAAAGTPATLLWTESGGAGNLQFIALAPSSPTTVYVADTQSLQVFVVAISGSTGTTTTTVNFQLGTHAGAMAFVSMSLVPSTNLLYIAAQAEQATQEPNDAVYVIHMNAPPAGSPAILPRVYTATSFSTLWGIGASKPAASALTTLYLATGANGVGSQSGTNVVYSIQVTGATPAISPAVTTIFSQANALNYPVTLLPTGPQGGSPTGLYVLDATPQFDPTFDTSLYLLSLAGSAAPHCSAGPAVPAAGLGLVRVRGGRGAVERPVHAVHRQRRQRHDRVRPVQRSAVCVRLIAGPVVDRRSAPRGRLFLVLTALRGRCYRRRPRLFRSAAPLPPQQRSAAPPPPRPHPPRRRRLLSCTASLARWSRSTWRCPRTARPSTSPPRTTWCTP